ncbi:XRE family transcriptional regulator [Streptomyces solaniscabiei]|uniref:XRE family transcriptional regulator n=1 Tax=Streptomyces solaniscabiei TaxID=2683255 RepID=UPI001CE2776A|nr:XRE family transcriptional regulator [Streptomyces solaniscabiei]
MPNKDDGGQEEQLVQLRNRLADGLARKRLTKVQVAAQARLGRTTVQEAFRADGPVPSAETVVGLANVLGLPRAELLELRRRALGNAGPVHGRADGPGKPIGEWDPHDLEVHPSGARVAAAGSGSPSARPLSGYVRRDHDQVLADAVGMAAGGHSQMLIMVGSSSTGKTRACWEGIQPLAADGWRLWHPYDPTRAEAALAELECVTPCTVVWLNEAQHYLGDPKVGERIAASLHTLLTHPGRGPVLILGTLWPEYADRYTNLPAFGTPDVHSRARELLTGRIVTVPDTFDQEALRAAEDLAAGGDRLMADALTRAREHGRVAQDLAGAPELLRRYENGSPAAGALLEAAMDARRLGVGLHLPQAFLTEAATDYLTDHDWDQLSDDWAEAAFADLARPVHGKQALLRRITIRPARRPPGPPAPATALVSTEGPVFRLADYLEQHGRASRYGLCPPASFWHAALTHLTHPDDLNNLADAAEHRHRLQWAHYLRHRAANAGSPGAFVSLGRIREAAGDREGAEALYRLAAEAGSSNAYFSLALMRENAGDREGAEAAYQLAIEAGSSNAYLSLALMRENAGNREGAEALARQAADMGDPAVLSALVRVRKTIGDLEGAEALVRQGIAAGHPDLLLDLARIREEAGDREGAEALARQAADTGHPAVLLSLALARKNAGDREGAEALWRQAADAGHSGGLANLAQLREEAGDREGAEALARRGADGGNGDALAHIAWMREAAGDPESAEALAQEAAAIGHINSLRVLSVIRESLHGWQGAEALVRQATDAGQFVLQFKARWPYGLDPDGSPTPPWSDQGASGQDPAHQPSQAAGLRPHDTPDAPRR